MNRIQDKSVLSSEVHVCDLVLSEGRELTFMDSELECLVVRSVKCSAHTL